jgi:hypothetical protein
MIFSLPGPLTAMPAITFAISSLALIMSDGRSLGRRSLDGRSLDGRSLDGRSLDSRSLDSRSLDSRSLESYVGTTHSKNH